MRKLNIKGARETKLKTYKLLPSLKDEYIKLKF